MHARFGSKCCLVSAIHLSAGCFGQLFADADGHEMEGVVKVKLLFEGKPKIWSFSSKPEAIQKLSLAGVVEDVEKFYVAELVQKRLHARLSYSDPDFDCEVDLDTTLALQGALRDIAAAWKRGDKRACQLTVHECLRTPPPDTGIKARLPPSGQKLASDYASTVLNTATSSSKTRSDLGDSDDAGPDFIDVDDLVPQDAAPRRTADNVRADSSSAEPRAKRAKRSRGVDGKLLPSSLEEKAVAFRTKLVAIAGQDGATYLHPRAVRCEKCHSVIQLGKDSDTGNFKMHLSRCLSSSQAKSAGLKGQMDIKKMLSGC